MKVIFMGTPDFSVPTLQALIDSEHEIVAVVAQPDRPKGRGKKLVSPPTIELAKLHGLPTKQPKKVRSGPFFDWMLSSEADVAVVIAYGRILPAPILSSPKLGCINLHASLLPEYRGAAPIHRAIMNGEIETGICTMQMDEGMDTGDVLISSKVKIPASQTMGELWNDLSAKGAVLMLETLKELEANTIIPTAQDHTQASYAPMLTKEDCLISWDRTAENIYNHIRGVTPWPGAWCYHRGERFKIWHTEIVSSNTLSNLKNREEAATPGEVISLEDGIIVATQKGALRLLEVQLPGKRRSPAAHLIQGRKVFIGECFSSIAPV